MYGYKDNSQKPAAEMLPVFVFCDGSIIHIPNYYSCVVHGEDEHRAAGGGDGVGHFVSVRDLPRTDSPMDTVRPMSDSMVGADETPSRVSTAICISGFAR